LGKAAAVFASVKESFDQNDFLRGFAILNHFLTNELSGIYMDICKDRLYCDAKESQSRRAAQSAMALISKSMLGLVAPVLTYTADEILDYAPVIFKGEMESIFDLVYEVLPEVADGFDDTFPITVREAFYEEVDKLKKEKVIKATLELEIAGDIEGFGISDSKDLEDWFVVSGLKPVSEGEKLAGFEVEGRIFTIHRATAYKCPRCWRFTSSREEMLCDRCAELV
jgi:isoleucyl-tRNA synthetase